MAYQFAGFFAKPPVARPEALPPDVVWREIDAPFAGVGVRLSALVDEIPTPAEVVGLAQQLGLNATADWIFLNYSCWGGDVDFVFGLGWRSGRQFGPVKEDDFAKTDVVFLELMAEFGVAPDDARRFGPFERGYWGDT